MRLLRASDVPVSEDAVFRYSRRRAVSLALLVIVAGVGSILFGRRQPAGVIRYVSLYAGAIFLFGLFFLRGYVTARFRNSNWLALITPTGLFLKFRSYLNYALPDSDQTVVFIPYQEIQSAGLLTEHMASADAQGHRATQTVRYVELDLSVDLNLLEMALSAERAKPAPREKHWYGTSSTLYSHYPVRVVRPSFVQVQWSATPRRKAFLKALPPSVPIVPPIQHSEDFTRLAMQTPEQQRQRLRQLDAAGQTVLAVSTARRLFGYDLATAKGFIDGLRNDESEPSASGSA